MRCQAFGLRPSSQSMWVAARIVVSRLGAMKSMIIMRASTLPISPRSAASKTLAAQLSGAVRDRLSPSV